MTNENAQGLAGHLQGRVGRRDQHPYYTASDSENQFLSERSEIPVTMTGAQMNYLLGLTRRVSRRRFEVIVSRLGFDIPVSLLNRTQAGTLIAELRRATEGRR